MTRHELSGRGEGPVRTAEYMRLGLCDNLVLHSQYLLIGLLVSGAIVLKVFHR